MKAYTRIGLATAAGLMAMAVGFLVAPAAHAAGTAPAPAPAQEQSRAIVTITDVPATMTVREVKRAAEQAAGTTIAAAELAITVEAEDVPATLLSGLLDGPGLDLTLGTITQSKKPRCTKVVIYKCYKCQVG
jgi:hypothetical protein